MKTINYYDEYFDYIEKPHLKNNHGEDHKKKALLWQENNRWLDECLSRPEVQEITFTPDVLQYEGAKLKRSTPMDYFKAGQLRHEKWSEEYTTVDTENYEPYKTFFKKRTSSLCPPYAT